MKEVLLNLGKLKVSAHVDVRSWCLLPYPELNSSRVRSLKYLILIFSFILFISS